EQASGAHTLAGENRRVRELAKQQLEREARNGEHGGTPEDARQGVRELRVVHWIRRHEVDRSRGARVAQEPDDRADHVANPDPTHPLLTAPQTAPKAESEREQELAERAAIAGEHDARAKRDDTYTGIGRGPRGC